MSLDYSAGFGIRNEGGAPQPLIQAGAVKETCGTSVQPCFDGAGAHMPDRELQVQELQVMSDKSLRTRIAFYAWLTLLLATLATFAIGISGHIIAFLGAPWLTLKTQLYIHSGIPVFLTAVKFVTVPILVALTPFASHHPTFEHWTEWAAKKYHQLDGPIRFAKKWFAHAWSKIKGRGSDGKPDGGATQ